MHQVTVEAIARELAGLEVDIATDVETRIAKLLIGCGYLRVDNHRDGDITYSTFETTMEDSQ
jgi:hypothetical protein